MKPLLVVPPEISRIIRGGIEDAIRHPFGAKREDRERDMRKSTVGKDAKKTLNGLTEILARYVGEKGYSEGAVEVLDRLAKELNEHRISNKALDNQVRAVEKRIRETEAARDLAYEEVTQSRQKLNEADSTAARLRAQVAMLEETLESSNERCEQLGRRLNLAEALIDASHAHYAGKAAFS